MPVKNNSASDIKFIGAADIDGRTLSIRLFSACPFAARRTGDSALLSTTNYAG